MVKSKYKDPFHVVRKLINGKHVGYDIYVNNQLFLKQGQRRFPLKRHEAYAIARLLNDERRGTKWADKFDDPYK